MTNLNVVSIITAAKEYTNIFYGIPVASLFKDKFFYWILFLIVFTFCSLAFISKYVPQDGSDFQIAGLLLLSLQILFFFLAIHIANKTAIIKAKKVVPLEDGLVSSDSSPLAEIARHKVIWLTTKYNCEQNDLAKISKTIQKEWEEWQSIQIKSGNDQMELAKGFFRLPKIDRVIALLAIILTILASVLITTILEKDYVFENSETILYAFKTITTKLTLLLLAVAPTLILNISILWSFSKNIIFWSTDKIGKYELSDRTLYRKLRDMQWLCGIDLSIPASPSRSINLIDKATDFVFRPITETVIFGRKKVTIPLYTFIAVIAATSTVKIIQFIY
ncbi:hypothetical protein [Pseudomonas nitroreducens]|uniref:hypothetical protein n=1 Tax=Pseudomonas nitroreducens TaxID=46680 RepID=UPI00265945EE|nr:hypothetical protein [Pseudomonas nitroreducens]MCP1649409.1 hypothetical protein [Pseudomonas nitroreducens]MCP1684630.1 hypothetical protein [Pseudomonas nitroreducens]